MFDKLRRWLKPLPIPPTVHYLHDTGTPFVLSNTQQAIAWDLVREDEIKDYVLKILPLLPQYEGRTWFVSFKIRIITEEDRTSHNGLFLLLLSNQDPRIEYEGDERLKWLSLVKPQIDTRTGPATNDY